ncbi:MAG: OB-fold nucleic acid binding domain-containing protein [Thermoproteota archaeon]|jgi:replication factor A1|nr:OB-fold nucleic acid binding domain-containing protein [Thermoproteota archaeon]
MALYKVKDITRGMNNITIVLKITSKSKERVVMTKYGESRVANAVGEDETGKINLTLWRDQIDMIKEGDVIRLVGAFVTEFRGQLSLNVGKGGKIEVLSSTD